LGPSSLPVVVAQPDERHANRTASLFEWYEKHNVVQHLEEAALKKKPVCLGTEVPALGNFCIFFIKIMYLGIV